MSFVKTALVAAALAVTASVAYADSSVPVQGLQAWETKAPVASQQKMMAKSWKNSKAPFTREAMEEQNGH